MMREELKQSAQRMRRVVGLDAHPDSFAAAELEGNDADSARVVRTTTRQPLATLEAWMLKYTAANQVVVLEASANSFAIAERLRAIDRVAIILESQRAARIGSSYLAKSTAEVGSGRGAATRGQSGSSGCRAQAHRGCLAHDERSLERSAGDYQDAHHENLQARDRARRPDAQ